MLTSGEFRLRRAAAAAVTLSVVILPALVCGVRIADVPVDAAERARLRAALAQPNDARTAAVQLYYVAAARGATPAEVATDDAAARAAVMRARLATVFGMFVLSGLLYASVAIARSRGTAVLACLALAALPPAVWDPSLRPEVPTAAFGMLGVLLLAGLPLQLRHRLRRGAITQVVVVGATAAAVGLANALAVGSLQAYGVFVLVPGICMLLALVTSLQRYVAQWRRRRFSLVPFWSFTRHTAPWVVAALATLVGAAWLLEPTEAPTRSAAGLWPSSIWLAAPTIALAVLGIALWVLRAGLGLGRSRRVGPDTVLLAYVLAVFAHRLHVGADVDGLPAAPALAICVAIGLRLGVPWLAALLRRGRSAPAETA